jgi:hypothetical protein
MPVGREECEMETRQVRTGFVLDARNLASGRQAGERQVSAVNQNAISYVRGRIADTHARVSSPSCESLLAPHAPSLSTW